MSRWRFQMLITLAGSYLCQILLTIKEKFDLGGNAQHNDMKVEAVIHLR